MRERATRSRRHQPRGRANARPVPGMTILLLWAFHIAGKRIMVRGGFHPKMKLKSKDIKGLQKV
jgi:hypothetical protein